MFKLVSNINYRVFNLTNLLYEDKLCKRRNFLVSSELFKLMTCFMATSKHIKKYKYCTFIVEHAYAMSKNLILKGPQNSTSQSI